MAPVATRSDMSSLCRRAAVAVCFSATLFASRPLAMAQGRGARPIPPVERLRRMSPEQRRRLLSQLPPGRRRELQERLDRYDKLTPEERSRLMERYDNFLRLPQERQQELRQALRELQDLPEARRKALRQEVSRLAQMDPKAREEHLQSADFKKNFSAQEQSLVHQLTEFFGKPE